MSIIRKVVIVELCILLALAVLTAAFGFNKGVWDRSTFFTMNCDANRKTYAGRTSSTVEIVMDAIQSIICFRTETDGKIQLSYEASGGDSLKTVRLFSDDGVTVLSDTYNARAGTWISTQDQDQKINSFVHENGNFNLGISDKAILDMAIGNTQSRLSRHTKDFLIGLLLAALGFAFNFITRAIIKLDKFLLGVFYDNAKNLRISEVGKDLLLVPGIMLFAVGLILCLCVLLS